MNSTRIPRYLGTPSGVIDLRDGRLLSSEEGRRKKITASIADPYDPEATHPDVQKLTAPLWTRRLQSTSGAELGLFDERHAQ